MPSALADPWVNTGDERTRHHLQMLASSGKLNVPLNTWPVMWIDIKQALDEIKVEELSKAEVWSYRYLKHSLALAQRPATTKAQLNLNNSPQAFTAFADDSREQASASVSLSEQSENHASKIQANIYYDAVDGDKYSFDGSYSALALGNWVLGIAAIDRWWGPGWQSSLILSNATRPAQGLFLQRKSTEAFSSAGLNLLGPWSLTLIANQLEGSRQVKNTKLVGARLNIKPIPILELGLSRSALWGGKGQPESGQSFIDALTGSDTNKQLLSYDAQLQLPIVKGISASIYGQLLRESSNTTNGDTNQSSLAGVELIYSTGFVQSHITLEQSDTFGDDNQAYSHSTYQTGYQNNGRPLGSSFYSNAKSTTLLGQHYLANGQQFSWTLGQVEITPIDPAHPFGDTPLDQEFAELSYKIPLGRFTQLDTGIHFFKEPMSIQSQRIYSGGYLGFRFIW
ncbi:capsule assembly Wzi family protein [Teredinibacter waterburyi]|uniref:capsule assembly Wzi family protein n=1 Tax=Teredinibacter waterburyi TaxID=1500538 RepID=UPI00165F5AA4|nr:capsule assembly Wzi family protein [Teredinibacter waterburyi]